ncbi:phosphoribosylanthranilate isomerase [Paenibacillus sophorae]|uniref:N-(5'-phosphoribosyl)anthranilate isomerase n=1 Tax=Paenibacillus sophorae TaxID=1333845 RepID=A0A1H8NGB3_9BACL|nr:phosphoribosylanthranilate isomerase [Paenibacillus sophorae]QWU14626.1 phosphoribosylanthranilate isomerase [Paenibacillus sophorae]SEO28761.1 phosphoribosylanthranilate isomerase [Paenibacillus sophorae]
MAEAIVKICGLQDVEVLKSMVHLPVDYIGLVFAPSRRKVSPEQASGLISVLADWRTGQAPIAAGVFVDPDMDELYKILSAAPLGVIQLHGTESPSFCRGVKEAFPGVQVWKALSVAAQSGKVNHELALESYAGTIDAVLLDTYDPVQRGGSGRTFAWEQIPDYHKRARAIGVSLFVAGGLSPDNVGGLITAYGPDGVDVSSGVESDGVKDIAKITAFVERVKQS